MIFENVRARLSVFLSRRARQIAPPLALPPQVRREDRKAVCVLHLEEPVRHGDRLVTDISIYEPSRLDIEALLSGAIMEHELHILMTDISEEVMDALCWTDADRLSRLCTNELPEALQPASFRDAMRFTRDMMVRERVRGRAADSRSEG